MKKLIILFVALMMLSGCSAKKETVAEEIKPEKIELLVAEDENGEPVSTVVYYDGKEVKTVKLSNPNEVDSYRMYKYNSYFKKKEIADYDKDMNLLSTQYFEYEGDNLISSLKTDINGKVLSEVVSETEDGNVTRQDFIYEDLHIVLLYSYDDNNELIKMETGTVDENGEITMNYYDVVEKEGDAYVDYRNSLDDEADSRIMHIEYGDNKSNYLMYIYSLDKKLLYTSEAETYDNLVEKSFVVKDGNGNVTTEYRYDEYGAITRYVNDGTVYEAK